MMSKKSKQSSVHRSVRAGVLAAFAVLAAPMSSANAEKLELDVAAGEAPDALKEFIRQTGLQLIFDFDSIAAFKTHAVSGQYEAAEALARMLADTGLAFEFVNERTVTVTRKEEITQRRKARQKKVKYDLDVSLISEAERTRVAQAEGADVSAANAASVSRVPSAEDSSMRIQLEEVVVTGSNIRGVENLSSPITSYTREDIARSGATNVADWLEKVPQNFGGGADGASPDGAFGLGDQRFMNSTGAVGPNLRGLGVGSTLTLINGRRLAPSAGGGVVDIGMIPLGAIERVEIVADGASAIYGSDAVGGVVNIILRDRLDGLETALSYGSDDRGGYRDAELVQSGGLSWNSGSVLLSGQYSRKSDLKTTERSYARHLGSFTTAEGKVVEGQLYPKSEDYSLFGTARQRVTERTSISVDSWFARRNRDQTNVSSNLLVSVPASVQQFAVGASIDSDWGARWRVSLPMNYSRTREHFNEDYYMVGVGQYYAAENWRDFDIKSVALKADGAAFALPAGEVMVAIGGERREEEYIRRNLSAFGDLSLEASRRVNSAYVETVVPLVGAHREQPGLHVLSMSLSGRHDDYSDVGSATTWKVGAVWRPAADWSLRSSFSTAFRAPTLQWSQTAGDYYVVDAVDTFASPSGAGFSSVVLMNGTRELRPEDSETLSIGFDYTSPGGLTLSGTYFLYDYTDRLASPPFDVSLLSQPEVFGGVFTPIASVDQLQALVDATLAAGGQNLMNPAIALEEYQYIVDMRYQNIAEQRVSGFDLNGRYTVTLGESTIQTGINATYVRQDERRITKQSVAADLVDAVGEQAALRVRSDITLSRNTYDLTLAASYVSGLRNQLVVSRPKVDDWLTFDLTATYRLSSRTMRDSVITLSVQNLLNEDPPHVYRSDGPYYDPANANPLGRFTSLKFVHKW